MLTIEEVFAMRDGSPPLSGYNTYTIAIMMVMKAIHFFLEKTIPTKIL